MGNLAALLPLLIFMGAMIGIGFYVRREGSRSGTGFVKNYFIGNHNLGGFVLAMTTVATYSSVSSFVGGPGMAWQIGFGWIYMAVVQVTAIFLVLGVYGKRVALLSRRLDAVTVVDIIRARFNSDNLAALAAFIIVLFFCATMTAQFVGGAKLFSAVTGYSYEMGLLLFGLTVVLYTAIGGFRAVALTDTCCAIVMMVGIVLLLYYVLQAGGGYEEIMATLHADHPEMFEPLSAGHMPLTLYLTQWILVGICTIALPQSVVRGISYKDTKGLHQAMLIGTVVVGFMNIGINFTGILAHGVLTGPLESYGGVDNIIPRTIVTAMPPSLVGFAIIGPLAASISTISGLLIVASSAIIKDVYLHAKKSKGEKVSDQRLRLMSMAATGLIGVLVFAIAVTPPSLIWIINMFAFGGLETAFFWVLLLGLFWRKANKAGALLAMAGGTFIYILPMLGKILLLITSADWAASLSAALAWSPFGLHRIVLGLAVSLICFIIGAYKGKPTKDETLALFFPGR